MALYFALDFSTLTIFYAFNVERRINNFQKLLRVSGISHSMIDIFNLTLLFLTTKHVRKLRNSQSFLGTHEKSRFLEYVMRKRAIIHR